jgi:hypothetical protein
MMVGLPRRVGHIRIIVNHSRHARAIFDRYNIVNERDLSEAAAKMDRHFSRLGILTGILTQEDEEKPAEKKPVSPLQ